MISRASEAPQSPKPDRPGRARSRPKWKRRWPPRGEQAFHARQIYRWVYRRGVDDIAPDDRPVAARSGPGFRTSLPSPRPRSNATQRSTDGTRKSRARAGRRPSHRVGVHSRYARHDLLRLHAGRLRHGLRLLPDRQDGAGPQPHGGRDRRSGARPRHAPRSSSTSPSTSC